MALRPTTTTVVQQDSGVSFRKIRGLYGASQQWAFINGPRGGGSPEQDREVRQSRYHQANDTWGRLVPVEDIRREVGFRKLYPRRRELPTPTSLTAAWEAFALAAAAPVLLAAPIVQDQSSLR